MGGGGARNTPQPALASWGVGGGSPRGSEGLGAPTEEKPGGREGLEGPREFGNWGNWSNWDNRRIETLKTLFERKSPPPEHRGKRERQRIQWDLRASLPSFSNWGADVLALLSFPATLMAGHYVLGLGSGSLSREAPLQPGHLSLPIPQTLGQFPGAKSS